MTIANNGYVGIGTTTPNAPLQFSNSVVNRKIVLWDGFNNDHQFYGLGINNSTLRYQVDATSSNHIFYAATSSTTSNELMRIQGNGYVGIGTSTPQQKLTVSTGFIEIADNFDNAITSRNTASGLHQTIIGTYAGWDPRGVYLAGYNVNNASGVYANTQRIYCGGGGAFGTLPISATAFTVSSARRFKENIIPVSYGLSAILKLKPVQYQYNFEKNNTTHLGLIAEDVNEIMPEIVVKQIDNKDVVGKVGTPMGINYSEIIPVLIKGMQEQQQMIEDLKKEIELLKNK